VAQSARIAIAQDIHDGIAQDLIALGYHLDLILAEPATPATVRHEVRTVRHDLSALIVKVRNEIFDLRSSGDFWIECDLEPAERALLLQVIPELLRNAARHSGASQIHLSCTAQNNQTVVTIRDNGSGGAKVSQGRYGLLGCIERVESDGGFITIESGEKGTTVAITL
jgi:signal transduction histidine kinase